MVEVIIDEVYPKNENYPMIVHFQNGYTTDSFEEHKSVVLENTESHKKVVATEINNILYVGEESEQSLGRDFLLIRNRKTGKTRLVEVGNVEVKPLFKTEISAPELETSYVDLGRKFGSKRHKKILEQNEKLKLNEDVVKEQLQNVSQNVTVDELDLSSYNKSESNDFYIPPINREANNVVDVYQISSILSESQYEQIFTELDSTDYKENLYPCVKDVFSSSWTKEQTVLAVYASTLFNTYNKVLREMKAKSFVACPYSVTLDKHVLQEFFTYSGTQRMRSAQYKDKALCHAMVFLYLINNYKFEVDSLCKSVKLTERTVFAKISMTGGWITKQGNRKIAQLKVPLNKPSAGRRSL